VEVMASLDAESVDAVVTDPPYGLEFMGKEWDRLWNDPKKSKPEGHTGSDGVRRSKTAPVSQHSPVPNYEGGMAAQVWHQQWAEQALRVLKPGGHLVAFGGSRTYHRMASAVEDAGFEIRDQLMYLYGSGFPKSHDVGKALDKAAGALGTQSQGFSNAGDDGRKAELKQDKSFRSDYGYVYEPKTPEGAVWDGWGTALKPAHEPIVLARKPLIGTVAQNVTEHGVGG